MADRFRLWGMLDANPTARMVVRGIDPVPLVELARASLGGLKWGTRYRDAKIQWQPALRGDSPWVVHVMSRGEKAGWKPNLTDLFPEDFNLIPGIREHMGEQYAILAARPLEPALSDVVISVEQRYESANKNLFAEKALEVVVKAVEAQGHRVEQMYAVKPKDLEQACPLNRETRVLVEKEAKRLTKAARKGL